MIKLIIWDFNGTVLDDVDTSVAAVNAMLRLRGLPPTDKETYVRTLVMPLKKYYDTVGIHNADIHTLSIEFRSHSIENAHLSKIFDDFIPTIECAKSRNIKNVLMSSLYEKYLFSEIEKYNIGGYFDDIFGMKDTGVGSKFECAKNYIQNSAISPQDVLFIGDLTSDYEISKKLGCKCILVPRGHMNKARCLKTGCSVADSLAEIQKYLKNN